MAKILAKIARRKNSNALPDRRELVEMDLFDTDRNPWPGVIGGGGGLWTRHDYDPAVAFSPVLNNDGSPDPGQEIVGPIDLVVDRTSLAVAFLGGVFNVSGSGDGKQVILHMLADGGDSGLLMAHTQQGFVSDGSGVHTNYYDAYTFAVLNPGTYQVRVWSWLINFGGAPDPAVTFTEFAATIALLPAGLAGLGAIGG